MGNGLLAKALYSVLAVFLLLCLVFGVAAIVFPEFREGGTGIITVILGALTTTLGSIMAGNLLNRPVAQAAKEEAKKEEEGEARG